MAFFGELGAKLTKTGQMTVQKANDLAEVTRLNMRTGELNKAIQEHYTKLGERYYALHAAGPEEDLAAICGLIDKANEELESIRLELQRIRQLKVCPACGAENNDGDHLHFEIFVNGQAEDPEKYLTLK